MNKTEILNTIVQYLVMAGPYLKQVGKIAGVEGTKEVSKQAIKKIGEGSWSAAKSIWQRLRTARPEMDAQLSASLDKVSQDQSDGSAQIMLRDQLDKILTDDPALLEEFAGILQNVTITNVEGSENTVFGGSANDNVVVVGDGVIIGDHNINLVKKDT